MQIEKWENIKYLKIVAIYTEITNVLTSDYLCQSRLPGPLPANTPRTSFVPSRVRKRTQGRHKLSRTWPAPPVHQPGLPAAPVRRLLASPGAASWTGGLKGSPQGRGNPGPQDLMVCGWRRGVIAEDTRTSLHTRSSTRPALLGVCTGPGGVRAPSCGPCPMSLGTRPAGAADTPREQGSRRGRHLLGTGGGRPSQARAAPNHGSDFSPSPRKEGGFQAVSSSGSCLPAWSAGVPLASCALCRGQMFRTKSALPCLPPDTVGVTSSHPRRCLSRGTVTLWHFPQFRGVESAPIGNPGGGCLPTCSPTSFVRWFRAVVPTCDTRTDTPARLLSSDPSTTPEGVLPRALTHPGCGRFFRLCCGDRGGAGCASLPRSERLVRCVALANVRVILGSPS